MTGLEIVGAVDAAGVVDVLAAALGEAAAFAVGEPAAADGEAAALVVGEALAAAFAVGEPPAAAEGDAAAVVAAADGEAALAEVGAAAGAVVGLLVGDVEFEEHATTTAPAPATSAPRIDRRLRREEGALKDDVIRDPPIRHRLGLGAS